MSDQSDNLHTARFPRRTPRDASEWQIDPTVLSLEESAWREEETLPKPFCTEVGRRMLLAQLEFSEWMLRRVEKVQFERDRSVSRRISIELSVRADAPVLVDRDGQRHWLVPLSVMRRRTLVNLDLRDEAGESITMLGLRFAQKLDQSVLRAAAAVVATRGPHRESTRENVDGFISKVVAGDQNQVRIQVQLATAALKDVESPLHPLVSDPLFSAVLARLRRNFTLYAMLPVDAGRHRLLRMSFDEPTDWLYQQPTLTKLDPPECGCFYQPGRRQPDDKADDEADGEADDEKRDTDERRSRVAARRSRLTALWDYVVVCWKRRYIIGAHMLAAVGFRPTRVRFQIPAAENAASYHFEITAPEGVHIVSATLLAGRPNNPTRHVSMDGVVGHQPTVGLHAVEIPNGSLCRAQVDLRVPTRGWLSTVLLSCWLIFAVLSSVWFHLEGKTTVTWSNDQLTNVALLLVTVSAASATFIAQRDAGGVAARMVTWLRALGALSIALPAIAVAFLVYANGSSGPTQVFDKSDRNIVRALWLVSLLTAIIILVTWVRTFLDERRSVVQQSPWDQTRDTRRELVTNFMTGIERFHFDTAAVGIESAEGWHERYTWTDEAQRDAVEALDALVISVRRVNGAARPNVAACCTCDQTCEAAKLSKPDQEAGNAAAFRRRLTSLGRGLARAWREQRS